MKNIRQYKKLLWRALGILCVFLGNGSSLQAGSTIFQVHDKPGQEVTAQATPQENRGPQLDLDLNNTPIVTFKAAMKECEAMALIPSAEAISKGVKLQIVYNNRLPMNHKWTKDTKILHELPFTGPVRVYNDSAGTSSSHGGTFYVDTNHNYGYRLLVNGQPVKNEGDYIKFIRHGYSTSVPYDISKLTLDEAMTLVEKGDLSKDFKLNVLDPLSNKLTNNEPWSGTHEGFRLVMTPTRNGDEEHGFEGSLNTYITGKSDCNSESLEKSGNWTLIQLKK